MASRLEAFDWSSNPIGAPGDWPVELRVATGVCLHSGMPTAIYWGRDLRLLYNDAWTPVAADRHPAAIGQPAAEVWSDIWPVIGPQFDQVWSTGRGFSTYDEMLAMRRGGRVEETYWNYSFTPIFDADGLVCGVFNQGHETTDRVLAARFQAIRLEIADGLNALAHAAGGADLDLTGVLRALGRQLGLSRVGYAEIDAAGETCSVVADWRRDGVESLSNQRFRIADFGAGPMAEMVAGRSVMSEDVSVDPLYADAAESFAAVGICANLLAPVVRDGRSAAMLFLNDEAPRRWTSQHADLARDVAGRLWSAIDRADATAKLRASERRFSTLFDQAAVGLSELDLDGRFLRVNDSMGRLLGRHKDKVAGLTIAEVTHPGDVATSLERLGAAKAGAAFSLEKRYLRPDGSEVWAVSNVTPVVDERDRPASFFTVTLDVTGRREQEHIREALLAELNHRVKNNLSTVQALARQTKAATSNPEEFEAMLTARLMALSRAQDLLMRETWTHATLGALVLDTLAPYAAESGGRIAAHGPEIRLSPTAAVTLALAFHELATNAARYGALSQPDGRVAVDWELDTSEAGGAVDLAWRESGGPPVAPPARRGFGSRLIERGAPQELGGRARLAFEPAGLACLFHLPLSRKIMVP